MPIKKTIRYRAILSEREEPNKQLFQFTDEDLEFELLRREWVQEELQRQIYRGERECTDADGVETMMDHA